MSGLMDALRQRVLLADGAMGTELQSRGLPPGACGEAWNVDHAAQVQAIQQAYVDAGSDCLISNTFGASRRMLERHAEAARVREINQAGVQIARAAFRGGPGFVLGDIGPLGGLLEPYGEITLLEAARMLAEQAEALVDAGVDAIVVETQTSLDELGLAIAAAHAAGAPLVIGSLAFDKMLDRDEVRTMMGVSPEQAAEFLVEHGADIVGLNCGTGVDMVLAADVVRRYRASCGLPVMAQPNAGQPVLERDKVLYRESPEQMSAGLPGLLEAGARIVGGCCGSTPEHIRQFRRRLPTLTA